MGRMARKMRSLLELYARLWSSSIESRGIVVARTIDRERFLHDFYYRNRPLLLRDMAREWPAVKNWTPASLAERFGDAAIECAQGKHPYGEDAGRSAILPLREFVRRIEAGDDGSLYLLATNFALRDTALNALLREIPDLSFIPDVQTRDADIARLWFGPSRTVTPLHFDPMNVIFVQIYGRKEFVLVPSFFLPFMANTRGVYSDLDPESDLFEFPNGFAQPYRFVVGPGDIVFIPAGWWHWVASLSVSISLNFANFAVNGVIDTWRDGSA
jgi:ribosomal protein L16 Arg81 hydroxylase